MLDKKKHHYLQLAVIFGVVTVISLMSAWNHMAGKETSMGMMGQSMEKMMSSMHAKNINLNDLFVQQESMEMATGMESHHQAGEGMKKSHFITTATIVILLPFIISSAAFLAVMWLK